MELPLALDERVIVTELLAEGFSAWVLKGQLRANPPDCHANTSVAVKLYKYGASDRDRLRLQRELDIGLRIQHPSLVPYVYGGVYKTLLGSLPFVVMELVNGWRLLDAMRQLSPSRDTVLKWTEQLLEGLGELHGRGLMHRDVHPANIIIRSEDASAVLVDYGLIRSEAEPSVTEEWEEVGARRYWAPECTFAQRSRWTAQSDLYMLGATLFHALSGERRYAKCVSYADFFSALRGDSTQLLEGRTPRQERYLKEAPLTQIDGEQWAKVEECYGQGVVWLLEYLMTKDIHERAHSAADAALAARAIRREKFAIRTCDPGSFRRRMVWLDTTERSGWCKLYQPGEYLPAHATTDLSEAIQRARDVASRYWLTMKVRRFGDEVRIECRDGDDVLTAAHSWRNHFIEQRRDGTVIVWLAPNWMVGDAEAPVTQAVICAIESDAAFTAISGPA